MRQELASNSDINLSSFEKLLKKIGRGVLVVVSVAVVVEVVVVEEVWCQEGNGRGNSSSTTVAMVVHVVVVAKSGVSGGK